jgi:hypothetical protein
MPSITLTDESAVALSGNYAGANVVFGAQYFVVLGTNAGITRIGKLTAQNFSTDCAFNTTVSLPAGTYNVGTVGTDNNIYIVNAAGMSGDGPSSAEGQGSANITSTLSVLAHSRPLTAFTAASGARGS